MQKSCVSFYLLTFFLFKYGICYQKRVQRIAVLTTFFAKIPFITQINNRNIPLKSMVCQPLLLIHYFLMRNFKFFIKLKLGKILLLIYLHHSNYQLSNESIKINHIILLINSILCTNLITIYLELALPLSQVL